MMKKMWVQPYLIDFLTIAKMMQYNMMFCQPVRSSVEMMPSIPVSLLNVRSVLNISFMAGRAKMMVPFLRTSALVERK